MKSNKILLVSLFLLAIISLGAVSAAEDATDLTSAVETDESDDVISEPATPAAEEISASKKTSDIVAEPVKEEETTPKDDKLSSSKDNILKDKNEVKGDDYYVRVDVNNFTSSKGEYVFEIYANKTGTYNAFVDGVIKINAKKISYYEDEDTNSLNLNPGIHTLKVTYTPNGGTEVPVYEGIIKFCRIDIESDDISEGETGVINAILPEDATGTVTVYAYDKEGNNRTVGTYNIVKGAVKVEIPGLTESSNKFKLEFKTNYGDVNKTRYIYVTKNDPAITAKVTPTVFVVGNSATISFNSHYKYAVKVYVDDELIATYDSISSFTKVISGLGVGQHKIKILADDGSSFIKTFDITVNKKPTISLSLKKLKTVKKSAKKVVLQATVKVNKKAKAKVKVTFKFNGKKYTAKTNSKGIAKVTIKKSVLKKLKKGKKITYQATYSTKTVKRTIKVKK